MEAISEWGHNALSKRVLVKTRRLLPVTRWPPRPKAEMRRTTNLGNRIEITIRDNGTGVPPDVKEKMFNPFFTIKPAGEGIH
jgi:signal transduction histidine kinase